MNCLIVGGTSGLGLDLAKLLSADNSVYVTGRHDPGQPEVVFKSLELSDAATLSKDIQNLINELPTIDMLIYSPGFYQEGKITDLTEAEINEMLNVCLLGGLLITRQILEKQGSLDSFIAVTSTSQYTPRLLEPVYTAAKAGLGAYANSLSLDDRLGKTLVAAPAGMKTKFHASRSVDMSTYLDSQWVAERIIELLEEDYSYRYARILRDPPSVEIIETRQ